jgi:hypothetical protein
MKFLRDVFNRFVPWWSEDEEARKDKYTYTVIDSASSASKEAKSIVASYRATTTAMRAPRKIHRVRDF